MKSKIDNNLRNAKNIGATIEKYLNEIGIFTLADLAETTSVKAFIKIVNNILKRLYLCAIISIL